MHGAAQQRARRTAYLQLRPNLRHSCDFPSDAWTAMTNFPRRTLLASSLALILASGAMAAPAPTPVASVHPSLAALDAARQNPDVIILQAGIFDPRTQRLDMQGIGIAPAAPTSAYGIVQFHPEDMKKQRAALRARGVELLGYVPNNAYYVRLNGNRLADLAQAGGVRWAGALEPAMKLDARLWLAERATSAARRPDGRYEIIVHAFRGLSSLAIANKIKTYVPGAFITQRSERPAAAPYVRLLVDAVGLDALIEAATQTDGVYYVAPWIDTETTNAAGIPALQGNYTGNCAGSGPICTGPGNESRTPLFDHGLTGSGQIVAVTDSGTTPWAAWFTTLDRGSGPYTAITLAENPPPTPPALGTLRPANKIIAYWTQPGALDYDYTSGHGTHTSGTVVGDAAGTFGANTYVASTPELPNHDLADGMAPNAQLLMQDAGPASATSIVIQDFEGTLQQAHDAGARVHNNSWGAKTGGQYSGNDENLDRTTFDNEALLVVVSAGNDVPGPMATGSPGNAKNALTVAALGHGGSLVKASYSNSGPTTDGRMKPDVAAPGSSTVSARNTSTYSATITAPLTQAMSGTSMAAPTVSGHAALVRQFFADGLYPRGYRYEVPPPSYLFADGFEDFAMVAGERVDVHNLNGPLTKAILLNATVPTTSPSAFPNTGTGWGRPWLDGNLWFKQTLAGGDDNRRLRIFERTNATGLETGDVNQYTITNVGTGAEFRVTLTWFDAEAPAGTASALVNNLDLEVVAPNSTVYLGNQFSAGVSAPGGSADSKDTVEQVRFTTPIAGTYTIRVKATAVPGNGRQGTDRQGYGLAVSGPFGLPDPVPFAAPTALSVTANGSSGIGIGASTAGGAQGFQLYRADGACSSAAAGDFHLVAHGTTLPLFDHRSQGGYQYAYRLRGVQNDVEGLLSDCIDVVSADACTLIPDFNVAALTQQSANSTCQVNLDWQAAQSNCPAATTIQYTVQRDSDPYFGAPTTLTTTAATPAFTDLGVVNGTAYYYRVQATDAAGNSSPYSRPINATPSGVDGPDPGAFLDDADTHSYLAMSWPWQITNTVASNGSYSYRSAADAEPYPDNTCAAITTPAMQLTTGATLSFKARYDLEYQWDGVVQEISTNGGTTWTSLAPNGGYPSSFAQTMNPPINGCAFPASQGAFSGVSTAGSNADPNNGTATPVFKPFTTNLSAYVGQTVMLRWRLSTDPAAGYNGFALDEVRIDGAAGAGNYTCTTLRR